MSPYLIVALVVGAYVVNSIKIVTEYDRGVIFRLGKLFPRPKLRERPIKLYSSLEGVVSPRLRVRVDVERRLREIHMTDDRGIQAGAGGGLKAGAEDSVPRWIFSGKGRLHALYGIQARRNLRADSS